MNAAYVVGRWMCRQARHTYVGTVYMGGRIFFVKIFSVKMHIQACVQCAGKRFPAWPPKRMIRLMIMIMMTNVTDQEGRSKSRRGEMAACLKSVSQFLTAASMHKVKDYANSGLK